MGTIEIALSTLIFVFLVALIKTWIEEKKLTKELKKILKDENK